MEIREQSGVIKGLFRYPEKKMPPVAEVQLVLSENSGIEGDHHADGGDRQISLVTASEKEWMEKQEVKGFCFKKYKENILLDEVSLAECRQGDLLYCGEVVLELTGSIKSCHRSLCKLAEEERYCVLAGSSRFARVKCGGVIQSGMKVTVKHGSFLLENREHVMEKQTILIRKIKENTFVEKPDEIAVEQEFAISLKDGKKIYGTCTPTHMEEMILGSRFLAKDFTEEELIELQAGGQGQSVLQSVSVKEIFRAAQECFENPGSLFADTGCAHSCSLVHKGNVLCQMEDIGRYNALDKVIGYAVKHGIPFAESYVFASGRISLGYIQKAVTAGFPMVLSRAAVTKAAVDFAKKENITLVGFIRKSSGNIYNEGKVGLNG